MALEKSYSFLQCEITQMLRWGRVSFKAKVRRRSYKEQSPFPFFVQEHTEPEDTSPTQGERLGSPVLYHFIKLVQKQLNRKGICKLPIYKMPAVHGIRTRCVGLKKITKHSKEFIWAKTSFCGWALTCNKYAS